MALTSQLRYNNHDANLNLCRKPGNSEQLLSAGAPHLGPRAERAGGRKKQVGRRVRLSLRSAARGSCFPSHLLKMLSCLPHHRRRHVVPHTNFLSTSPASLNPSRVVPFGSLGAFKGEAPFTLCEWVWGCLEKLAQWRCREVGMEPSWYLSLPCLWASYCCSSLTKQRLATAWWNSRRLLRSAWKSSCSWRSKERTSSWMISQGACSDSDAALTLATVPYPETGRRVLRVLGGHTTLLTATLSVVQRGRIAEDATPLRGAQEDNSSCTDLTQVSCIVWIFTCAWRAL